MTREKEVIDHEARGRAGKALTMIQAHEKQCGERWGETRDALKALRTYLIAGQGALILFLAGLIVTLALGGG